MTKEEAVQCGIAATLTIIIGTLLFGVPSIIEALGAMIVSVSAMLLLLRHGK